MRFNDGQRFGIVTGIVLAALVVVVGCFGVWQVIKAIGRKMGYKWAQHKPVFEISTRVHRGSR